MAKKKNNGLTNTAVNLVFANTVVGSIPNPNNNPSITNIKGNFGTGTSNIGAKFPAIGKIKGTTLVLGSVSKLQKVSKKVMKGGNL